LKNACEGVQAGLLHIKVVVYGLETMVDSGSSNKEYDVLSPFKTTLILFKTSERCFANVLALSPLSGSLEL
jgi:hypothetical protein